ncbi:MAG: hypothetical protein IIX27_04180 [Ruminococcus sp.]|nr:hypothetical protein [Ruminococcus sp.]
MLLGPNTRSKITDTITTVILPSMIAVREFLVPFSIAPDCHPEAVGGFAAAPAGETLEVVIPEELLSRIPESHRESLRGVLAQDPRPHYHDDPERVYGFGFGGMEVKFTVAGTVLTVRDILSGKER